MHGDHFEVHRFHPPLIYGRRSGEDDSIGIAMCRVKPRKTRENEDFWFLMITYKLPIVSAKVLPQMVKFVEEYLGTPN